jgi:hypothetical protein
MSEPVNLPEPFSLVSSDLFSMSISGPTTLGSIAESSSQIVRCTLQGVVEVMSCSRYSRPFQSSPIRYYPCASSHPVLIGVIHDPSIPAVQMAHIKSQTCPSPLRFAFRSTYMALSPPLPLPRIQRSLCAMLSAVYRPMVRSGYQFHKPPDTGSDLSPTHKGWPIENRSCGNFSRS